MTLTEIRLRLEELGVRPSRRLGQNFLHDQNVAQRIVALGQIEPHATIIEIGPGLGALTEFIVELKPKLTLLEMDHRLAAWLRTRFPTARLIEGDALQEISKLKYEISDATILGNLPYSVASPLIVELCQSQYAPRRMIFTIQLEVAERLVAKPRTTDYGLLTLLTQPFFEINIERKVPASVFWPQPEVASAVVSMQRRVKQPFTNPEAEERYRHLVKEAFQKRRKTLRAIFGANGPANLDPSKRPEEIDVDQWIFAAAKASSWDDEKRPTLPAREEEVFDVVDEHDQVIGQEKRSKVHRKGLRHRAVHIFIWNRLGELLLQKRSYKKDVAPNTWDSSAAGHLGVGEEYDIAANRETEEELGLCPPLSPLKKFTQTEELGEEFVWLYEGKSEGPFKFPESEISELRWWTVQEIEAAIKADPKDFAPSFRFIWRHQKG